MPHRVHGERRRALVREPKYAGGDAAERKALHAVFGCKREAGAVTGRQPLLLIGDKWKVLILRDMEEKGLLTRKVYAEVPPRVEYTLTDTGYSLRPILDSMVDWGRDYQRKNGAAPCVP